MACRVKQNIKFFTREFNTLKYLLIDNQYLLKQFGIALFNNRTQLITQLNEKKQFKFEKIKSEFLKKNNLKIGKNWFFNFTDIKFPSEIQWLLSLSNKFSLPIHQHNFPLFQTICDIEDCIRLVSDEKERDVMRARITNILMSNNINRNNFQYSRNNKDIIISQFITKTHDDCIQFLRKNKHIIIIRADKGGSTVALKRSEYEEKMISILNDQSTYIKVERNPLNKLETESNNLIRQLFNLNVIDKAQYQHMTRHNVSIPRIYALPKVHKSNRPLRPIVSTIDSPSSQLAIYLNTILSKIVHKKYDITNSVEAREKLTNIIVENDEVLASFDVISLFPSIPMDLVIRLLETKWHLIQQYTTMPQYLFLKIIHFVLIDSTYFLFKRDIYKQINGCAMGSNISPTIANIVTNEIFDVTIPKLSFKPRIVLKYVDDIFTIGSKDKILEFLQLLNSFHNRIQFTVEHEFNGKLPYLDLLISKKNNRELAIDWYQKDVFSGKILNYLSHHPRQQKMNVIYNLFSAYFL
ncbi:uncharacterized protein LOC119675342 [Teleopsis dalmanni]|uniref:uncharacterized protein LOC119675342 n=1 Tax=Teleopsis dalmanni TaxID=139649 RepID=UPI0018CE072E|nr:uncharacterized protein LOC119675342 [Teleopsis dalmanni]